MEIFVPYLVILLVIFAFFVLCWFVLKPKNTKKNVESEFGDYYESPYKKYGRSYGENPYNDKVYTPFMMEEEKPAFERKAVQKSSIEETSKEETLIKEKALHHHEDKVLEEEAYATKVIPTLQEEDDATKILPVVSSGWAQEHDDSFVEKKMPEALHTDEIGALYPPGVQSFLSAHPHSTEATKAHLVDITKEAFQRINVEDRDEQMALLENLMIEEALVCMQKAYLANPVPWMKETALEAFVDVVEQPRSSTAYIVAFDALHVLPHLTLGHFQVMALVLLFKYSRNSNNFTEEALQHYAKKYIEPFLSDLYVEEAPYQQLEYLRCAATSEEKETFATILSHNYPYVFAYKGCTEEELMDVLQDNTLDDQYIVDSMNSPLVKLACVDDAMARRLFQRGHINDGQVQVALIELMRSRPVFFTEESAYDLLSEKVPLLASFSKTYNNSLLSQTSLTLLGLYLARTHVKIIIGEHFDLSRWF